MRSFHFHHHHRVHVAFSDFWLYELSVWLHTLAQSLVSIFIPVLMLKAGYGIGEVVWFLLLLNLFDVPLNIAARSLVRRLGARVTIAVGTLASIAFFVLFLHLSSLGWPLLVALAFFAALYDSFYWVAHFYLFANSGGSARAAGRSTGIVYAVRQVATLIGPAVGAAVLIFSNQSTLLYITVAALLLSLIPLLWVDEFPDKPTDQGRTFGQFFALPGARRSFFSTSLYAIHDTVETQIFPIFIFLIFGTIESVAFIPVLLSIVAIAVALGLGRLRPERREEAIAGAAFAISLLWIVRLLLGGPLVYYASVLAVGLCAYFVMVPLDSAIFAYGHKVHDTLSTAMYRNICYMLTNALFFAVLLFFIQIFKPSFVLAAASLAAIAALNALPLLHGRSRPAVT